MENRNEIGKIFKDKLALLDKEPSKNLWASIETDLRKKRKRRILFWFLPSLLTAVIATSMLFLVQTNQDKNNTQIQKKQNATQYSIQNKTKSKKQNRESQSKKPASLQSLKYQDSKTKSTVSQTKPSTTKIIGETSETKTIVRKNRSEKLIKQSSKLVASTDEYEEYEVVKKYKVIIKKNQTVTTIYKPSRNNHTKITPKNKTISYDKNKVSKNKPKKTSNLSYPRTTDSIHNTTPLKKEMTTEPPLTIVKKDTIKTDTLAKKLERKPNPKREYVKKDYPQQKTGLDPEYSVSAYYGPAIFNPFIDESTINKSFNNFSKTHPITSHYGFYFKSMYGKIGFRVGVAHINLKLATSITDPSGIRYENIIIKNYNSADINTIIRTDGEGKFEQKISYYEMPLEFNYALIKDNNPFGMEAFTGFSILILDENKLSFSSESFKKEKIAELKNLSETNLSFNLGLGFNYKITEKLQLDFNPIFKYYLTTYNDDSTSKPYSLSIQSGATYKF